MTVLIKSPKAVSTQSDKHRAACVF